MRSITKMSAACALAISLSVAASAQNVVLFNDVTTSNPGVVTYANAMQDIATISGVTAVASYGAPFTGTTTFSWDYITGLTTLMDGSVTLLSGTLMSTSTNNFVDTEDSTIFTVTARGLWTGGTWLDQLRELSTGTPGGTQMVSGFFSAVGTAFDPTGVNKLSLSGNAVPEPGEWAAMGMLLSGLGGLVIRARRRA